MGYAKKTPFRKKVSTKKKTTRSKPRTTRKRFAARPVDNTVQKLNPGRERLIFVKKSYPYIPAYFGAVGGINGMQIEAAATGFAFGKNIIFDPTGTFGNCSGVISTSAGSLTTAAIPEWAAYSALYSMYKVTKIHLRLTCADDGAYGLQSTPPTLYLRYLNEYLPPVTGQNTTTSMSEERNWVRKQFTAEHPDFTYSFYPKVMQLMDNTGSFSTETRTPKAMHWTNVNTPVELYGLKMYFQWPSIANAATTYINIDITYDIVFKEQS